MVAAKGKWEQQGVKGQEKGGRGARPWDVHCCHAYPLTLRDSNSMASTTWQRLCGQQSQQAKPLKAPLCSSVCIRTHRRRTACMHDPDCRVHAPCTSCTRTCIQAHSAGVVSLEHS